MRSWSGGWNIVLQNVKTGMRSVLPYETQKGKVRCGRRKKSGGQNNVQGSHGGDGGLKLEGAKALVAGGCLTSGGNVDLDANGKYCP